MTDLQIRPMTAADVPQASELFRAGGWGERRELLELALSIPTIRPLVGIRGGEVVAAGQATVNGSVGWVGSIFVRESLRGHGYGRAMTAAVCDLIDKAGCATRALIASDLGRPLYEKMGFRVDATYRVFEARPLETLPAARANTVLRPMRADDLDRVGRLDSRATGEDRRTLLGCVGALPGRGWVLESDEVSDLLGFAISILPGAGATVASEPDDAACLLDLLRHLASGRANAARAAIVTTHQTGLQMLAERGWQGRFDTPRMLRGPSPRWNPALIWSLLGFAFG